MYCIQLYTYVFFIFSYFFILHCVQCPMVSLSILFLCSPPPRTAMLVKTLLVLFACLAAVAAQGGHGMGDTATLADETQWYNALPDLQYWLAFGQSVSGLYFGSTGEAL